MIKIELKTILGGIAFTWESENNTHKETVREFIKANKDKTIRNIDLSNIDLSGLDFSNSRFDNSSFVGSSFDNSSFDNSRFDNSSFDNSSFDNSSFDNSSFDNSSFDNSSFYNSSFDNSSFDNSRFDNSSFDNSSFDNSSFYNSSFYNSSFDNSSLYNSSLYNSSFDNSRFDNSRFDNSSFDNSSFYNSSFYNSSFYNSSFDEETVKVIINSNQQHLFSTYKNDMWAKMLIQFNEIQDLREKLMLGKIDGSCYEGECSCFCGTIATIKGTYYKKLDIAPDSKSPVEMWFLPIKPGMTPENSEIVKLTVKWIDEFIYRINVIVAK